MAETQFYSKELGAFVEANCPETQTVPWDEFLGALDDAGVAFTLEKGKKHGVKGGLNVVILGDKERADGPLLSEGNVRITCHPKVEEGGKVVYTPVLASLGQYQEWRGDYNKWTAIIQRALGVFATETALPEPVTQLPEPPWIGVTTDGDWDTGWAYTYSRLMFLSEAEQAWAEFIGQDPFA